MKEKWLMEKNKDLNRIEWRSCYMARRKPLIRPVNNIWQHNDDDVDIKNKWWHQFSFIENGIFIFGKSEDGGNRYEVEN